ncbi:ubiquitin carboxyl-terminal hydrolase 30-like protein [Leptotrombidium deliense]|uniref:ubiquitinyl hydrolase 1 n=1 Tax=Leptotrombidium deliense TaxID=299467 RepID=A0A443SDX0_9ACAR|nr:ubiquitin carboxyl-terminal hydrolase 30-like protein [Leptotrombidium deliense]
MEVLDALVSHNYRITNQEEDAHELFNLLTTTLERELYSSLPLYSLRDALLVEDLLQSPVSEDSSPRITTRGSKSVSGSRNPVSLPTRGMFASQMQCNNCGHRNPVLLATFQSVTLTIPNKVLGGTITLQECLQRYVSSETISDVTCDNCSFGHKKSSFTRKITFGKLPQLLCFHFHRLTWHNTGVPVKRSEYVNFPEFLNMDEFMYTSMKAKADLTDQYSTLTGLLGGTSQTPVRDFAFPISSVNATLSRARYRYRLCSVIVHIGNPLSGHYITFRRGANEDDDKWYFASDSQVMRVLPREVMSSSAYMLFYERVKH